MAALWDCGVRDPKEAGGDSSGEEDDEEGGGDGGAEGFTLDEVLRLGGTKVRGGGREAAGARVGRPPPRAGPVPSLVKCGEVAWGGGGGSRAASCQVRL